jgi:asparagine synthase (glutamine-hydrolysing)
MCGIAVQFAHHAAASAVDELALLRTRDHMTPRGPDGAGTWISPDRRVGLAHRRLAIIDLSPAGAQPMHSADGKLVIVFNGEIYNHRQLRAELEARGRRFQSHSDTEVLLHLYAEHGRAMLGRLRGMFAFALWDSARRGMLLARDTFGIKPLYLADDGRTLRAASQVKALLAGSAVDTAPEPAGHVGFFLWGHVPEPYTLHRGIRSLPAGDWLWVGENGVRESGSHGSVRELLAAARPDAAALPAETARAAFADSVRHHLEADVPVGVFLSAGLDSTALAGLAAEQGGKLRTVTLGFREFAGTPNDEVPLAESVARHYGAEHRTIWVTRADFQAERAAVLRAMDQPSTDGVNTYFVSRAARAAGLKVALSGLGGDELLGGYPSFRQVPQSVRWLAPWRHVPALGRGFRAVAEPFLRGRTSTKYAGLLEFGGTPGGAYLLRRGMFMPWELPGVLDPDLVRAGWRELQPLLRLGESHAGLPAGRATVSALEAQWYMRNQLLRDSDWASMAHSLEVRVPLVDTTLWRTFAPALASGTPPNKQTLARSPARALPEPLLNRPKTGFFIPVRDWLLGDAPAAPADRGLRGWARHVHAHWQKPGR